MPRLFFALPLPSSLSLEIDAWRERNFNHPMGRLVPPANFHVTLAFAGECSFAQMDQLIQGANHIQQSAFDLCLDRIGYFSGADIVWLGTQTEQPALMQLNRDLMRLLRTAGIRAGGGKQGFVPHVSLIRHQTELLPLNEVPTFSWQADHFALYESVKAKSGVQYQIVEQWPLRGRTRLERLRQYSNSSRN